MSKLSARLHAAERLAELSANRGGGIADRRSIDQLQEGRLHRRVADARHDIRPTIIEIIFHMFTFIKFGT